MTRLTFLLTIQFTLSVGCGRLTDQYLAEVYDPASRTTLNLQLAPRHYKAEENCRAAVAKIPPLLKQSVAALSAENSRRMDWLGRISSYHPSDCISFAKRGQILRDFDQVFTQRTNRIGMILPAQGSNDAALNLVLAAFKKTLQSFGIADPDEAIIIKRIDKDETAASRAAAELIHMDRVALVVATNSQHIKAATQHADLAQVPLFVIHPNAPLGMTKQSMRVYPPTRRLAERLASHLQSRSVNQVSVFVPLDSADNFLEEFSRVAPRYDLIVSITRYASDQAKHTVSAVKSTIPRLMLSQQSTQAVLILDNFKMVRHIVNIITTTLPRSKIIFAGNQQWRSPALTTPREDALQGAVFVDFIGRYTDLPSILDAPTPESPFFTTAQAAGSIDYGLLGYRLGVIAGKAVRSSWSRQRIASELQKLKNQWDNYFPTNESVFLADRSSSWPSYLFMVQDESILLVP